MKKSYSENDSLRNLAQNLGFNVYIFDDPINLGAEIKLRDKSKDGEVDSVLLHENIVILANINKGIGSNIDKEKTKFFEKLDHINEINEMDLYVKVTKKKNKNIAKKETLRGC